VAPVTAHPHGTCWHCHKAPTASRLALCRDCRVRLYADRTYCRDDAAGVVGEALLNVLTWGLL
jgi:hypothetical protein